MKAQLKSTKTHTKVEAPSKRDFLAHVFQLVQYCEDGICSTRNFHIQTLRTKVALVKKMATAIREEHC